MLPQGFKPNLAVSSDDVTVQPKVRYVSQKLDGVRCIFFGGVAYSRSLKPLPNKLLQNLAQKYAEVLEGCDSEVIAGGILAKDVLQRSVSFAMKEDKVDDFTIFLFDRYDANNPQETWFTRYVNLLGIENLPENVEVLRHYMVIENGNYSAFGVNLDLFEQEVLAKGGEGVIARDAEGLYKFGRSGKVKPSIQKLKRFQDDQFVVISYSNLEINENEKSINELGLTSRSSSRVGKKAVNLLGSLTCTLDNGNSFSVGSGFTMEQRASLWEERETLVGKYAKVKFFGYSPDGIPLLPTFLDFRDPIDFL